MSKKAKKYNPLKEGLPKLTGKIGSWEFDAITLKGTWTEEVADIYDLDPNASTDFELGLSFFQGESRLKIKNAIKEAIDMAIPYDLELELLSAKGNHKWVRSVGIPIKEGERVIKVHGIFHDITDKNKVELAIRMSEEHYRLILENQGEGICIVDLNELFVFTNPATEQIFEVHPGGLINRNLKDFVAPEQLSLLQKETEKRSKGEKSSYELDIVTSTGDKKTLLITATPQYNKEGIHTGAFGVFSDITKRKQVEFALKERVKEIECLQKISSMIDKENLTIGKFFNKTINLIPLGMQYPEKTGCRIVYNDQFFLTSNFVHNEHTISSDLFIKDKQRGKIEVCLQVEHLDKHNNMFLKEEKDLIKTIAKIISEFIEHKRNEQIQKVIFNISNASNSSEDLVELIGLIKTQLSALIDTTNFYVALYDESTNTITIPHHKDQKNNALSFPIGKTLTNHLIRTQKPLLAIKKKIAELVESGLVECSNELPEIWLGLPLIVRGKIIGVLALQSYEDIKAYNYDDLEMLEFVSSQISISIERKKVEQDLRAALEKAKESDKLKSTFLATMSHELRTPLNAIIGFSEILQEEIVDYSKVSTFANIINSCGLNLLAIIEDIFEITLIESGEVKITQSEFNLKSLMDEVYTLIELEQEKINKKNLKLIYKPLPLDGNIMINTDKSKVKQVLINLLKNALKFTFEGSVEFGFNKDDMDGVKLFKFYVKDTGIGIRDEDKEIIFDYFRQVDDSNTRLFGGTGLGLSIARRYINFIGGNIWVESSYGIGSTFFFTIPYKEPLIAYKLDEHQLDDINSPKLTGKTILIAEDEVSNYALLMAYLEKSEAIVLWAKNGEEAVSLCESNSIDLVLMDIKMQRMNGLDATSIIRKKHPNLPIIAQTAFVLSGDDQNAYNAGCNEYIGKPIKRKDLFALLAKYLVD